VKTLITLEAVKIRIYTHLLNVISKMYPAMICKTINSNVLAKVKQIV